LDEPTNGLDPVEIAEIRETLQRWNADLGLTMLISSRILSELSLLATTYGVIHDGKIIKEFTKAQLEEECRRCLRVVVDDVKAAVIVLETVLGTTRYKVVDLNEIRVYDYLENPAEVTVQMSAAHVRISAMYEMGASLEDYIRTAIREAE
jgi:ABC-2 type transport system ATP-binding protein